MTQYEIVLSHEESFATSVATGVRARKPLTIWHLIIPFMFVYELITMKKDIGTFAESFLFIRKLALDSAYDINKGEDRKKIISQVEGKVEGRLRAQGLFSPRLHQGQMSIINLLIDHYSKLFKAQGKDYASLVKNAYKTRSDYETFLKYLTLAEREVDTAVTLTLGGGDYIRRQMMAKEEVIERLRKKEIERVFPEE